MLFARILAKLFASQSPYLESRFASLILCNFFDIPNRVTIYHDDLEQEKAVKNALAPEKPRYFNGSPTYQAESVESFKQKLADVGMSLDR